VKFILDNLFLIAIALVSGGLLLWPLLRKGGSSTSVSALEATQLINHRNAIVVDVREEKDYAAGTLAGARNMPLATLADRAVDLMRFKSRPVVIVCDAGQRSASAIATFKAQGFDEAYSLAGGLSAWKQAGLPLVPPGREQVKSIAKEPGRKSRNEQRNRSGNKRAPVLAVAGEVGANDSANDTIAPVEPIETGATAPEALHPGRLKEIP
jgi:rhodanese-related sulfurtransferase